MSNRLANETSPYLLQHKDNPVDWFAWGDEAFETARGADRPILLSVGYSACHWCHVMEHESFENEAIAALMNENFVNIKVDREERPDVDAIYMQAVQSLTGRGGWPMTVFLTPDGRPFYGGTYFPPEDRQGMPGFPRLLTAVAEAYRNKRSELFAAADQVTNTLASHTTLRAGNTLLTTEILDQAYSAIRSEHDEEFGGFGRAPKFPQPMTLDYLLRHHKRTGDPEALEMVQRTLDGMAYGGMYDQVGGGFHRYSTDQVWLVPHFEKMLYDNALLAHVYLDAFKVTGMLRYRRIVEETLQYVMREMTHADGGFFSTQDADSEGEEGKFFLWTPAQLREVLADEAAPVGAFFDVSESGNFEGSNILNMPVHPEQFAEDHNVPLDVITSLIGRAKQRLYEAREQRVHPARDEKVITAWNGMMMRAFAEAGFALDERYTEVAVRNADFLLRELRPSRRLLRTWKEGVAKGNGYLEDYALLIDGLLATYQATFASRFLRAAIELADEMIDLFWDDSVDGFYDTGKDHETLISRPRDFFDNATPSGTSVAMDVLLHLAALTGNQDYERRAATCLRAVAPIVTRAATGFGRVLCVLDYHVARSQELAIVWAADGFNPPDALLDVLRLAYLPHLTIAGAPEGRDGDLTPLLSDRPTQDGRPTAYVCEHFVCQLPATDPAVLKGQLGL